MKEEEIDSRMERVVKSYATKRADMKSWDEARDKRGQRLRRIRFISVAAVVAIVVGVGMTFIPGGDNGETPVPVLRGGVAGPDSVRTLIDEGKFQEAIKLISVLESDTIIDPSLPFDEREYIRQLQEARMEELRELQKEAEKGLRK